MLSTCFPALFDITSPPAEAKPDTGEDLVRHLWPLLSKSHRQLSQSSKIFLLLHIAESFPSPNGGIVSVPAQNVLPMQRSLTGISHSTGTLRESVQKRTTLHVNPSRLRIRGPVRLLASAQVYSHLICLNLHRCIQSSTNVGVDCPIRKSPTC